MRLVDAEALELVTVWHRHYRRGAFPVAGGLLDQSAYYLEAMTLIDQNQ